jgi:hypothetical protein
MDTDWVTSILCLSSKTSDKVALLNIIINHTNAMSVYTYRLRAAKGLDATLIKELRWHLGLGKD